MSSKKTISINPELFSMSGNKKKKNGKAKTLKKKENKFNFVNPNQLRKNLLNKIKEHRTNSEVAKMEPSNPKDVEKPENIEKFSSNFKDSMNYLTDLVEKEKKEKKNGTKSKRKRTKCTVTANAKMVRSLSMSLSLSVSYIDIQFFFFFLLRELVLSMIIQ